MRVFIYLNLHRRCLSVRSEDRETRGRVIAHVDAVELENASFVVSQAGRQRALREKRKNVHAGIRGELVGWLESGASIADKRPWQQKVRRMRGVGVTYDPYRYSTFVDRATREPVFKSARVVALGSSVVARKTRVPT
ncbi:MULTISPECIES: hypothetical protein [unclassified Variovorax]|uniref:hypothetical protein n=1 Tax=unclassified Variovorax TaxID=663243 RepID=UPI00076C230D|nr:MULTISPECIES: hypothetical protein [unclassified Variovorax]KWT95596.1 hypothetical protein APY03_2473 [Variovorax sp. WDL1]PNG50208.1 hypothetical protein CHC06_05831 [Variovorax sp. B2]PNG51081.1 hypothetical protein CHC07_05737 [Variovorax sp. B4]VTU42344.1 hypothetical protein SRS16P1_00246 [Variovorax sp. SRS16]VTU42369.1 hypothetical protein E5P1_00244 [Variovorax sp. PBL-E5]